MDAMWNLLIDPFPPTRTPPPSASRVEEFVIDTDETALLAPGQTLLVGVERWPPTMADERGVIPLRQADRCDVAMSDYAFKLGGSSEPLRRGR